MQPGFIPEANDPERDVNAFRLASTALDAGHTVETFLLGDGVEAPVLQHEKIEPHSVMLTDANESGELFAGGTCMDSREIEPDDLRPQSTMGDRLRIVEESDEPSTIG